MTCGVAGDGWCEPNGESSGSKKFSGIKLFRPPPTLVECSILFQFPSIPLYDQYLTCASLLKLSRAARCWSTRQRR
jgi:hypothetical protein